VTPFWLFLIVGVALLATELLVFQFTTFWLFFVGLGALVAAVFAWLSPGASYLSTTLVFALASALITAVLFVPIKKWLQKPSGIEGNNAVGQRVVVKKAIAHDQPGVVVWSGSEWQAELAEGQFDTLDVDANAIVESVQGIRLIVTSEP